MKFKGALNNFIAGEWSPKMAARTDTEQYTKACKLLRNAFTQLQGGAFKRPGWRHVIYSEGSPGTAQGLLNNSSKHVLFSWIVDGVPYIIFGNDEAPTSGIATHPWFVMNTVTGVISNIVGSSHTDDGDANIEDAQIEQVGDVLFIVSPGAQPRFIRFEGATIVMRVFWEYWSTSLIGNVSWKAFPFQDINSAGVNGTITATGTFTVGGSVTLQASSGLEPFTAGMDDGDNFGIYAFFDGVNLGLAVITAYTDTNTATALVVAQLPGSSPKAYGSASGTAWAASAWGPDIGWPTSITSYQQRLYFGRGNEFWGSRIGNVFDMYNLGIDTTDYNFTDDNSTPWNGTLTTTKKGIQTMSAAKTLVLNCGDSETIMYGQGALGKRDVNIEASTFYGAEAVKPVRVNNYLTFVQNGGRKLRDVIFNFDENQYKSNDLAFPAEHLTLGDPIRQIVAGELYGASMIFARTASGALLSATLDRDYQINAWAKHPIGGDYQGGEPEVISLCVVPSQSAANTAGVTIKEDVVYALIRRTINAVDKVYMERIERFYDPDDERALATGQPSHAFYLDGSCMYARTTGGAAEAILGTTVSGTKQAGTTWTGLTRHSNETVSAFLDGVYIGEVTVSNTGTLTTASGTWLYLGYKYKMQVQPTSLEFGAQIGSAQGIHKRANDVYARFYKSVGCKYGIPESRDTPEKLHVLEFRETEDLLNSPVPLKTWDMQLSMPGGYRRTLDVYFESEYPYPCNILALVYGGLTYDL